MNIKLLPAQTATLASSPSTVFEVATGVDHQLDGLHRSEPVYKCDVFNPPVVVGASFPFQVRLPQSFTESLAVWVSREIAPSLSQQRFRCCRTNHSSHIPVETGRDCPTACACCQPTLSMVMPDLPQLPGYEQQYELEEREQSTNLLTSEEWLCSSLVSHNYHQQQAFNQPELHPLYNEQQVNHELQSVQDQTLTQDYDEWLASPTHSNGHLLDLKGLEMETTAHGFNNTAACLPTSTSDSVPYNFPPTPPCSTRAEAASPDGKVPGSHELLMHNAPPVGLSDSSGLLSEPLLQNPDLTLPSTSQYILPEPRWPDEEFVKLFQPGPFVPDLESFDHSRVNQPVFDNFWKYPKSATMQNTTHPDVQNQQSLWSDPILNQLNYSSAFPSIASDAFDPANPLAEPNVMVSNYNRDTPLSLCSKSATSTTRSSLFDGLSPDVEPPAFGRRIGSKTHYRATIKDQELIQWKEQGLSYKEIKARGGFSEAESTLRGRFRTLTKPKHLRVRKPEWQQKDVSRLCPPGRYN